MTARSAAEASGPLAGITIVAVEQAVSAPFCSRTLADLGARVIKVENPRGGDFARRYDDVVKGMAAHFVWLNRGKESVALDLRSPAGLEALHRLLAGSDALVTNLGPGVPARIGLDAESLAERHPHLVAVEISGYGSGGPLSGKRAYDLLVQAESGACAITGWEDMPAKPGPPMADACTGLYGAMTILAGLHERGRTGRAARASLGMFDVMVEMMGYALTWTRYTGVDQTPIGMSSPAVSPYGAYRTADGRTVVLGTTNDAEFARLAGMIDRPDLAHDARYARNPDRVEHRAVLDEAIAEWCRRRPLAQIQEAADAAAIGNSSYNTPREVVAHPHLQARDRWQPVDSPVGEVVTVLPPAIVPDWPEPAGAIPAVGEHTGSVLAEFGFTAAEIEKLQSG